MAKLTKKKNKKNRGKLLAGGLKEISPGVLVGPNYKPGQDPALDAVLRKLKENPGSLDTSGMGRHYKI